MQGTMTRRFKVILISTTTVIAVIVATLPYFVSRVPLAIALPVSVTIALFGVVFALTSGSTRVVLLILLLGADMAALVYFVPGIRAAAATSLSAIFSLRGPPLEIAVLATAMVALFGVILAAWGGRAARTAGITMLVVALFYLIPNLLTGSFSLIIAILAAVTDLASAILAWFNGIPGAIATVAAAIIALIGVLITQIVTMIIQIVTIRKAGRDQTHEQASLALEQAQDNAIRAYLDQMSDLLVDRHLRSLPKGSDIHKLAEAKTVEILLGLDSERKRRPLKLVYGLGLINNRSHTAERDGAPLDVENLNLNNPDTGERDGALLDLENLSLDHADLTELSLRDACLRFADLRGANLQGSDLSGADLSYADLRGANLTNTDLSAVNLSGANLLPYDEHEPARLSLHNLKDHPLPTDHYLQSLAKLHRRLPRWVIHRLLRMKRVTFTNLTDAKLDGANLTGAILANADLRHTRESLDRKQIELAIGNDKTKLPDEFKPLPRRWMSEGIEAQIKEVEEQVREEKNEKEWEAQMKQRGLGKEDIDEIKEKIKQIEQRLNE